MFRKLLLTLIVATSLLSGCASVVHEAYCEPKDPTKDIGGFVYYESSPYLLIYPDGKGQVSWEIKYLADPLKKRIAKPNVVFAKLDSTLVFDNGVLSETDVTADSTAIGKAAVDAVKVIAGGFLNRVQPGKMVPEAELRPQIYKIIVAGKAVQFWGSEADEPVVVPIID